MADKPLITAIHQKCDLPPTDAFAHKVPCVTAASFTGVSPSLFHLPVFSNLTGTPYTTLNPLSLSLIHRYPCDYPYNAPGFSSSPSCQLAAAVGMQGDVYQPLSLLNEHSE